MSAPLSIPEAIDLARNHHRAGRLPQAEQIYRAVLRLEPDNPEALHLLGLIAYQVGRHDMAVEHMDHAIRLNPQEPTYHNNLGLVHRAQGRLDRAIASFREAVRLHPHFAGGHGNLGTALKDEGRLDEAGEHLREAVRLDPQAALHHYNLGNLYWARKEYDDAVRCYDRALALQPDYPEAHNNRGGALLKLRRWAEAGTCFEAALARKPGHVEALNNLGMVRHHQGRCPEAAAFIREALRLQPDFAEAHNQLGRVLFELRDFDAALAHYHEALRLRPDYAEAHANRAHALWKLGRVDEAVAHCRRAVEPRPDDPDGYTGLGITLLEQGHLAEAQKWLRQALEVEPRAAVAHSNLLIAVTYDPDLGPAERLAEHRRWGEQQAGHLTPSPPPDRPRSPQRRLRVGYVSPDLRTHVVARLIAPVLTHHDRQRVEAFCYAEVRTPDTHTEWLRGLADQWRSTCGLDDAAVADLVRADGIDILVDLAGHTGGNRLLAFARKPAPVQVTYLGYPNTTGLAAIDYRLTDAIADPPGEPVAHTEELVRLPGPFFCYHPPEDAPPVGPLPAAAAGRLTFGSLHTLAKLNPAVFDVWARVLHALPGSRLLVFRHTLTGQTREDLCRRLTDRGIARDRIELRRAPISSGGFHLPVYQEIDVLLDAFPWSAHATACESLWMGVPLVTLRGDCHAGRMAASALTHLGLTDWIAETPDDYVAVAVRAARDAGRLADLRRQLRERVLGSPLCDGRAFTRGLEEAYRAMWRRWCAAAP
jgi:predicted O-linked N-acetylglucosamine transferase (SPINDLY family)